MTQLKAKVLASQTSRDLKGGTIVATWHVTVATPTTSWANMRKPSGATARRSLSAKRSVTTAKVRVSA